MVISYWLLGLNGSVGIYWLYWDGAAYLWHSGLLSDCLVFVDGFTEAVVSVCWML